LAEVTDIRKAPQARPFLNGCRQTSANARPLMLIAHH
jgi:hypothetical protein